MQKQFFVLVNGEQQGPFSVDQLKGYLAMGQFQYTDLAWHEGAPDWKPLGDFPEFPQRAHRTPNYGAMRSTVGAAEARAKNRGGKSKLSGIMTAIVTVLLLAGAGVGGYFGYNYWKTHHGSDAAGAAAGGAAAATPSPFAAGQPGIPKTAAELNTWYEEPPAGQNAATYLKQGADGLQITDAEKTSTSLPLFGRAPMPPAGAPVPAAVKTTVRTFLEKNQSALDAFEKAEQCSGSRYSVDFTQNSMMLLRDLGVSRIAAQVSALYTLSQADAHNGTNAAHGVALTLAAARSLEGEPILVAQFGRFGNSGMAVDALEQAVNRSALPPESLAKLQTAFDHASEYDAAGTGLNRALVGERVGAETMVNSDELKKALSSPMVSNALFQATHTVPKFDNVKEQLKFGQETIDQLLGARVDSLPGRLKADDVIAARTNEANSKSFSLMAMVLPELSRVTSREAGAVARLRLAQTAIALERFRSANMNRYPESLNELAPKFINTVPNDPFTGQPLHYRKAATGYVLYSVGADLKDDMGARRMGTDDIPFIVIRPPRAL